MLLLERCHDRHHHRDKLGSLCTLGPETAFTPQDTWADRPLGGIIGWLDAFHAYKGPQRVVQLPYFPAHACGLRHPAGLARLQQPGDFPPPRTHHDPELGGREGPIADAMPRMKHLMGLLPQGVPNLLGAPPTLTHRFKIAQQMRPAHLCRHRVG
jgi:hypothetical protein